MATGTSGVTELNSLFNDIYEDAVFVARAQNVMAGLVTRFSDSTGDEDRKNSVYPQITAQSVGEYDDFSAPTKFDKTLLSTLTPVEYMAQSILTDRRLETDPQNAKADCSRELGESIADNLEENLLDTFTSLTGGTVGAAGSAMTWGVFFAARTRLAGAKVPGPYVAVLHEYQWHDLASAVAPGVAVTNSPVVVNEVASSWYVGTVGNVDIYTTPNVDIDGSDDAVGAMFNRQAIALDSRRAPRMEPERDASKRAWELNITHKYAHGTWRPAFGCQIKSDATAPTGF